MVYIEMLFQKYVVAIIEWTRYWVSLRYTIRNAFAVPCTLRMMEVVVFAPV